jgi:hypothetical protein
MILEQIPFDITEVTFILYKHCDLINIWTYKFFIILQDIKKLNTFKVFLIICDCK